MLPSLDAYQIALITLTELARSFRALASSRILAVVLCDGLQKGLSYACPGALNPSTASALIMHRAIVTATLFNLLVASSAII